MVARRRAAGLRAHRGASGAARPGPRRRPNRRPRRPHRGGRTSAGRARGRRRRRAARRAGTRRRAQRRPRAGAGPAPDGGAAVGLRDRLVRGAPRRGRRDDRLPRRGLPTRACPRRAAGAGGGPRAGPGGRRRARGRHGRVGCSGRLDHRVLHRLDVTSAPGQAALRERLASLPVAPDLAGATTAGTTTAGATTAGTTTAGRHGLRALRATRHRSSRTRTTPPARASTPIRSSSSATSSARTG